MANLSLLRGLPLWLLRIVQTLDPDPLALANRWSAEKCKPHLRTLAEALILASHLVLAIFEERTTR
jgi:hypothetical protein